MQASLSRSVIGPAGQAGGGSKQIAEYALPVDGQSVVATRYRMASSGAVIPALSSF